MKLGRHGGPRAKGVRGVTIKRGSNSRGYLAARLRRDGLGDLASEVEQRKTTVRQARATAGYRLDTDRLTSVPFAHRARACEATAMGKHHDVGPRHRFDGYPQADDEAERHAREMRDAQQRIEQLQHRVDVLQRTIKTASTLLHSAEHKPRSTPHKATTAWK